MTSLIYGAIYHYAQQRKDKLTKETEERKRQREEESKKELLILLQDTILPLQTLPVLSFSDHRIAAIKKEKKELLMLWRADGEEATLSFHLLKNNELKDGLRKIFVDHAKNDKEQSAFFSFIGDKLIINLKIGSKGCPISQEDGNFSINPQFKNFCGQIKFSLDELCKDEEIRVADLLKLREAESHKKNEEDKLNQEIAEQKILLIQYQEQLKGTNERKTREIERLNGLIVKQVEKITKLDANFKAIQSKEEQKIKELRKI